MEIDCSPAECPAEMVDLLGVSMQTQTLSLTNHLVPVQDVTWGSIKSLYGR